jgi:putative two-component system response regulator
VDVNKATILLVEDDPAILKLLEYIFKKEYDVMLAINGKDALEKISEQKPDLIISDIMMPEMTGLEFKRDLNEKPETATIPFIFLTAMSDKQTRDLSMELGANEYIVKPVRPPEIKDIVKSLLE